MAALSGRSKSAKPKLSRAEKKAARGQRWRNWLQTWRNVWQVFNLTRKNDPRFLPVTLAATLLSGGIVYGVGVWLTGSPWLPLTIAITGGLLVAMLIFTRWAQRSMYSQAEGQAGAAGWVLDNQLRGDWRVKQAVAGTTHFDVVHRLIGRPGVVLIGEGAQSRVRPLIAQEKKKVSRLAGDTPIYDLIVGTDEGDVRLGKLQRYLVKLPTNLSKEEVTALDKRLAALTSGRAPLPQGPMPQGGKMRNMQRTIRRRA